jgi:hypothetical protein
VKKSKNTCCTTPELHQEDDRLTYLFREQAHRGNGGGLLQQNCNMWGIV